MKLSYDINMPNEVKGTIEPLLQELQVVIPLWVNELYTKWDDQNTTGINIHVDRRYLRLILTLGPTWLTVDEKDHRADQRSQIIHELCHAFTTPIHEEAIETILTTYAEDTPQYKLAYHTINSITETCTENLRVVIEKLLSEIHTKEPEVFNPLNGKREVSHV